MFYQTVFLIGWGSQMAKCDFCGRNVTYPYKCNYCGGLFCDEHRLPTRHNCPNIELWKRKKPPSLSHRSYSPSGEILLKPYIASSSPRKSVKRKRGRKLRSWVGVAIFLVLAFAFALHFSDIWKTSSNIPSMVETIQTIQPIPTPVDLREKLWRYKLEYALEVALSSSELSKIQDLAMELKGKDIYESAWNILKWEDKNIEYDYLKANIPPSTVYYRTYDDIITDVEVICGTEDYFQTPYETVRKGKGVCRDYALLTAGLLLAMNYSPVYVLDITYENKEVGHVVTAIKINNQYFILDQHLPVWDLGRYYHHQIEEGEYIKNATIYEISKGEDFAHVKKIGILTADDFIMEKYTITSNDLRRIELDLLNMFEKKSHLHRDFGISDLDQREYLPSGYSYGRIWTLYYDQSFYHPRFHDMFINYVFENVMGNDNITADISKCNRFWIKVGLNGSIITIKLILGKW